MCLEVEVSLRWLLPLTASIGGVSLRYTHTHFVGLLLSEAVRCHLKAMLDAWTEPRPSPRLELVPIASMVMMYRLAYLPIGRVLHALLSS